MYHESFNKLMHYASYQISWLLVTNESIDLQAIYNFLQIIHYYDYFLNVLNFLLFLMMYTISNKCTSHKRNERDEPHEPTLFLILLRTDLSIFSSSLVRGRCDGNCIPSFLSKSFSSSDRTSSAWCELVTLGLCKISDSTQSDFILFHLLYNGTSHYKIINGH